MAEDIGSLVVRISADVSNMEQGLRNMQEKANSFGDNLKKLGGVIAGVFAVNKIVDFLKDTIDASGKAEETMAQLNAVIKSTGGVAGVSAESAVKLAEQLSNVTKFSKGSVLGAENMLLTFTNIGKSVFPQATTATLNMSQALGQDLKSSSIQLGKALNDPVAGVTALQRVGVKLTEAQKEQIKSFVAVGDTASAQKVILKELDTEFGNSAVAAGTTFPGKLAILNNKFEEVKKTIGDKLIPVVSSLVGWFLDKMPAIQTTVGNAFASINKFISPIISQFSKFFSMLEEGTTESGSVLVGFAVIADQIFGKKVGDAIVSVSDSFDKLVAEVIPPLKEAWDSFTKVTWPLLMDAFKEWINGVYPVLADAFDFVVKNVVPPLIKIFQFVATEVVPAVAAAFKEWMPKVVAIVKDLWEGIKPIIQFLVDAFNKAWPLIKDSVMNSINVIKGVISGLLKELDGVIKFVTGIFTGNWGKAWEGIKEIFSGVWESLSAIGKGAINGLINTINAGIRALNSLNISVPDWVPDIGGKNFSLGIPEIPKLAKGSNFIPFDTLAFIHRGEAVVPAKNNPSNPSASNPLGGDIHNHFYLNDVKMNSMNDIHALANILYKKQQTRNTALGAT